MRTLKERGLRELAPLKRRVKRAYAMGRIDTDDFKFLNQRLDEVEARIISMRELNEQGEEVLEPYGGEEAEPDSEPG
jgi:hypothetical protein